MTTDWRDEIIKLGPLTPEDEANVKYEPFTATFHDISGIPIELTMFCPVIKKDKK